MNRIEVITSVERRRRWSRSEKEAWVAALMEPGANATEVAKQAGVDRSLLYRWRQQLAASRDDAPAFVPVTVAPSMPEPVSPRAAITIAFGASVRVTIEGSPDQTTLANVIDALAGAIAGPDERSSSRDDRLSERRSSLDGDRPHRHEKGIQLSRGACARDIEAQSSRWRTLRFPGAPGRPFENYLA
jgi:transposase